VSCLDRLGSSPPEEAGSASEPPGPWVVALMVRVVTEETMRLGLDGHVGEVLVVLADNADLAVRLGVWEIYWDQTLTWILFSLCT
jgi:hypothetical protein